MFIDYKIRQCFYTSIKCTYNHGLRILTIEDNIKICPISLK